MKESFILRQISDYLTARRVFWFRLNTGTAVLDGAKKRIFRSHTLGAGAADILALPSRLSCPHERGEINTCRPLWIEVKQKGGKQSKEQREFQQRVEELGHLYVVARSFLDVEEYL